MLQSARAGGAPGTNRFRGAALVLAFVLLVALQGCSGPGVDGAAVQPAATPVSASAAAPAASPAQAPVPGRASGRCTTGLAPDVLAALVAKLRADPAALPLLRLRLADIETNLDNLAIYNKDLRDDLARLAGRSVPQ